MVIGCKAVSGVGRVMEEGGVRVVGRCVSVSAGVVLVVCQRGSTGPRGCCTNQINITENNNGEIFIEKV